ncbi:hypothetical protein H1O16_gp157 [Burkholderia phage BcepSaruman]|uniref:Uncharacterized protein n=1 Tax=Burkholderia phage BcepSaruman TaxID=2530032 RepID=A0A4D5ZD19_9CAUD|nr:hypothetical protein H1O16_gp157 [Burkholderia phage BcepSaruman]QBX06570.1 hypothetical protein BcepSaruman_157 [Burkholderia phage BcepSaruman]
MKVSHSQHDISVIRTCCRASGFDYMTYRVRDAVAVHVRDETGRMRYFNPLVMGDDFARVVLANRGTVLDFRDDGTLLIHVRGRACDPFVPSSPNEIAERTCEAIAKMFFEVQE